MHHIPTFSSEVRVSGAFSIPFPSITNLKQIRNTQTHTHTTQKTHTKIPPPVLTVGLECSEEGGEQGAADANVHQLRQGVQSQLRGEVVEERVWVLSLVLLHQLDQVLHRGKQGHKDIFARCYRC